MARLFRARWLILPILIIVIAGGYAAWQYFSNWESTDDAQIEAHIHPVNAKIGGTVISVNVQDNQHVASGIVLVQLDARDYEVAFARAGAELAAAQAAVLGARAGVPIASSLVGSQVISAEAIAERAKGGIEVASKELLAARARLRFAQARVSEAQANSTKAARDLDRMKQLIAKDEISQQQYDAAVAAAEAARATVESAQAAVFQAEHEVAASEARVSQARAEFQKAQAEAQATKTAPEQVTISRAQARSAEARVQLAKSAVDQARLNMEYTTIKAPVSGIVSKKTVEAGQVVQAGQPLMAIIPAEDVWVTANFKETQLADMQPGQTATVSVDAYDGRVYNAHVDSIASATGAKFSLLPPENATGNYVKVVQRVPVKLILDQGQDTEHQLRPGMSVVVKVRVK
ncbi:MAG: HlyD family secretion protein [Acidobacteria bacterium]|nr:MAG: HlyD family secretion protein [Acidobacteriota bacterium]